MFGDTIAAISTAWGSSGIAIVRLSGPASWSIALKQVRLHSAGPLKPRFARNASLLDEEGQVIDEILLLPFRGPKSYSGEDLIELHCHGGTLSAQRCLELLIKGGARMALPGEFTRRAFENGRLDLSQAEAVGALIEARSNEALRSASRTLNGELSLAVERIYSAVTALGAEIEVGLDFPEEDVPYIDDGRLAERLREAAAEVRSLMDRCSAGVILREGIRVALVGRPNAGKSSLLNALLQESRAIVTAIPGTTRDIIEAVQTWKGVPLRLTDTAGITEDCHDEVEAIGVRRALDAMKKADVRLWVMDGSRPLAEEDFSSLAQMAGTPFLAVVNKSDLPVQADLGQLRDLCGEDHVCVISAAMNTGLEMLKEKVVSMVTGTGTLDSGLNASARQISELQETLTCLRSAQDALESGLGQALAAGCLADARACLTRLMGGDRSEDLLHEIFGRFCIGK